MGDRSEFSQDKDGALMATYNRGAKIGGGKTKDLYEVTGNPHLAILDALDKISAGDGAKLDVMEGKGACATQTTVNVFRLLEACGVPTAFVAPHSATSFIAKRCQMIPLEVVVRRMALGSYLKRNPHIPKGTIFPRLVYELYLKTNGQKWEGNYLGCDDPIMRLHSDGGSFDLFHPKRLFPGSALDIKTLLSGFGINPSDKDPSGDRQELIAQLLANLESISEMGSLEGPIHRVPFSEVEITDKDLTKIEQITRQVFLILERAWSGTGRQLCDFKLEFGRTEDGELVLADVVDNDSWRLLYDGEHEDKQRYRDGEDPSALLAPYMRVAQLTEQFRVPRQLLVVWRGSESDPLPPFDKALDEAVQLGLVNCEYVVHSMHRAADTGLTTLDRLLFSAEQVVVIAMVGMSNAAGPIASTRGVPVISVPANADEWTEDVWSSLRMPASMKPAPITNLTAMHPRQAVWAALDILAQTHPGLWAYTRGKREGNFANMVEVA